MRKGLTQSHDIQMADHISGLIAGDSRASPSGYQGTFFSCREHSPDLKGMNCNAEIFFKTYFIWMEIVISFY